MNTITPVRFNHEGIAVLFEVVTDGVLEYREVLGKVENYSAKTTEANVALYLLTGGKKEVIAERLDATEGRWELGVWTDWR